MFLISDLYENKVQYYRRLYDSLQGTFIKETQFTHPMKYLLPSFVAQLGKYKIIFAIVNYDYLRIFRSVIHVRASLVDQKVKNLPAVQETWVQSLGQEDSLEKGMATHSSRFAWRIPWTEEPGIQSMGSQKVGTIECLTLAQHTQLT